MREWGKSVDNCNDGREEDVYMSLSRKVASKKVRKLLVTFSIAKLDAPLSYYLFASPEENEVKRKKNGKQNNTIKNLLRKPLKRETVSADVAKNTNSKSIVKSVVVYLFILFKRLMDYPNNKLEKYHSFQKITS